ncbi:MAG: hypothetical protein Q9162_007318 [Coniocarpon cinnabarinum]
MSLPSVRTDDGRKARILCDRDDENCNGDAATTDDDTVVGLLAPLRAGSDESLAFFFHTFGSAAASNLPYVGYADELRFCISQVRCLSPLSTLTLAAAHFVYGVVRKSTRLLQESRYLYGRALTLTRDALDSRSALMRDEMLLSVILMCFYELHLCLARGECLKTCIGKFSHVVDNDQSNYGTQLTGMSLVVPELRAKTAKLLCWSPVSAEAISLAQSILRCAVQVDQKLQWWQDKNDLVPHYQIINAQNVDWVEAADYPQGIHVYPDLASVAIWDCCRMARIHVQVLVLRVLRWLGPGRVRRFEARCIECRVTALHMVDDICATVPFRLGNRRPMMEPEQIRFLGDWTPAEEMWGEIFFKAAGTLIAPLVTCAWIPFLHQERRQWIHMTIKRIYNVLQGPKTTSPDQEHHHINALRLEDLPFALFSRAIDVR